MSTRALTLLALPAALLTAGCGAAEPQVPGSQSETVERSLAGMAQSCGEAHQVREFGEPPAEQLRLEAHATYRARQLASVYRKNPQWVYQGTTLREMVALAVRYLRECELPVAASALERGAHRGFADPARGSPREQ